jgi:hypothetical protein
MALVFSIQKQDFYKSGRESRDGLKTREERIGYICSIPM